MLGLLLRSVEDNLEVCPEEVNEMVKPVQRAQDGHLLALVTLHQELRKLWDHFCIELQVPVRWVFEIFKEVLQLLKSFLPKFIDGTVILSFDYSKELSQEPRHALDDVDIRA